MQKSPDRQSVTAETTISVIW